jgi:hypothetical protein
MSDPGRDDDNNQDVEGEAADRVSRLVDGLGDSPFSTPLVIVCLLATFGLWIFVLGFPSTVAWVLNLITSSDANGTSQRGAAWFLIMGLPFILPFVAVYSIARSRHPDIEDESRIETGMMAGYAYRQRTDKRWQIWLLSGMAGALNCLLLLLFYKLRR